MEFTDHQTLNIHGHSERSYTSETPAVGLIEEGTTGGTLNQGGDLKRRGEGAKTNDSTRNDTNTAATSPEKTQQAAEKYWVSERSYGEFNRSFTFPTPIDRDHVQASMKNGILNVVVPKTHNQETRKITIS